MKNMQKEPKLKQKEASNILKGLTSSSKEGLVKCYLTEAHWNKRQLSHQLS